MRNTDRCYLQDSGLASGGGTEGGQLVTRKNEKGENQDKNEKVQNEKGNVEERCLEVKKRSHREFEDVNGEMLGKDLKHYIHRNTKFGLHHIGHRMPTLDKKESQLKTFPLLPVPP